MPQAQSIEAPDFDQIEKESGRATRDGMRLLWGVANFEHRQRRKGDRRLEGRLSPKVLYLAPTVSQNNLDTQDAGVLYYTGASSVNITGYLSREEGDIIFIHVAGAGTISHTNQDAASDATNRFVNNGAATVAAATNQSIMYIFLDSRWREWSAA